jgi:hypothetical protein
VEQSDETTNVNHAPPTTAPNSTRSVRCELTRVRTVISFGNINAEAISPELPNPTPNGFAAKRRSPASHIFGLFITAPSSAILGHIHHAAKQAKHTANMMPQMVGTAFHRRPRPLVGRADPSAPRHHNTAASIAATTTPVREYVIASITHSATPTIRPVHRHLPHHPQQNGNSAQIAAAAWLGFANPKAKRAISPTTNSITTYFSRPAVDDLHNNSRS